MGYRRVYVERILYHYNKSSINNGFFDRNVNKYGDFFVKYVVFLLTYIMDMILLSMILINNTNKRGQNTMAKVKAMAWDNG